MAAQVDWKAIKGRQKQAAEKAKAKSKESQPTKAEVPAVLIVQGESITTKTTKTTKNQGKDQDHDHDQDLGTKYDFFDYAGVRRGFNVRLHAYDIWLGNPSYKGNEAFNRIIASGASTSITFDTQPSYFLSSRSR